MGDSTFSEIDLDGHAWWFRPVARKYEGQVKKMRTQGLAALVHLLGLVSKHRPRVVVGMQRPLEENGGGVGSEYRAPSASVGLSCGGTAYR